MAPDPLQIQRLQYLFPIHTPLDIGLVGKHQQTGARQPLFLEETVEFLSAVLDPQPVRRVDDPDQRVGLFKVVAPVRAEGLLAAYVPFCWVLAWRLITRNVKGGERAYIYLTYIYVTVSEHIPNVCSGKRPTYP